MRLQKLWHGRFNPSDPHRSWSRSFFSVRTLGPPRHPTTSGKDHDLPVYRRYIGAAGRNLDMPTLALAMHIDSMGPVDARSASRCR